MLETIQHFPYWGEFFTIVLVHILGVASPGPDFVLVTKQSIAHSRRVGVWSALGVALGIAVHVGYSLLGIGLVISQSIILFSVIKYVGAAYLLYIGYKALRAKKAEAIVKTAQKQDISTAQALRTGFFTNVLNPKATLFILSVFTQVIDPATPLAVQVLYGSEMVVATFVWFAIVAMLLSTPVITRRFTRVQHWFERTMGAILIALGIKVALSRQ